MASSAIKNRILGCLYGQTIGDALGTRYEFKNATITRNMIKKESRSDGFLPILGGGPFGNAPGQVTDDTELAMAMSRSMNRCGTYDPDDVAESYHAWYRSNPFDIGNTTRNALAGAGGADKSRTRQKIVEKSLDKNKPSLSNGCLMRISPLAIAGHQWKAEVQIKAAKLDCCLTNPNQVTQDAVATYVTAIRTLIHTGDKEEAFKLAAETATTGTVKQLLEISRKQAVPVLLDGRNEWVEGDSNAMGYFGVAFQSAFHELLNGDNFHDSLKRAVERGGDTDTNGCIVGALIGSYFGAESIPKEWQETVVNAKPARLAKFPDVNLSDLENVALALAECSEPNLDDF